MNTSVQKEIQERSDLAPRVEEANTLLETVLGASSAALIQADWSLDKDAMGRPLLLLRLSDWTGSVGYRFAPDELDNKVHMTRRLQRLWGDLLQVRSHVQLDENWWHLQQQGER